MLSRLLSPWSARPCLVSWGPRLLGRLAAVAVVSVLVGGAASGQPADDAEEKPAPKPKVVNVPNGKFVVHRLPIIDTAKDAVGKAMVANIVSLGVIAGLSKVVSREAIERAVLARVPKGTGELNRRALEAGFALAGSSNAA